MPKETRASVSIPVLRKSNAISPRPSPEIISLVERAYKAFHSKLENSRFRALALDYDGTCISSNDRRSHPPAALVDVAIKLLQHGVPVCFASGRGSSMFDPLRDLLPKHLWSATIVATHNGALIQSLDSAYLDEEGTLIENQTSQHFLRTFERAGLSLLADVHLHAQQYSILPKHTTRVDFLWRAVQELCQASEINVEVRSTGHSVDVVPSKHDKAIVLKYLHERHNILPEEVLCIGDQGRWPGNDLSSWQRIMVLPSVNHRQT